MLRIRGLAHAAREIASAQASPSRLLVQAVRSHSTVSSSTFAESSKPTSPRRRRRAGDDVPLDGQDLIGPPDPVSNIRPVKYGSAVSRKQTANSPYSTEEFPASSGPSGSGSKADELEFEYRLRRERVDAMNHHFWAETNTAFEAQRDHRLASLPPMSDPPTPEELSRREKVLDQFYADWQAANRDRMAKWVWEWWGEVWAGLRMQSRVHIARLLRR